MSDEIKMGKKRGALNRTVVLNEEERRRFAQNLVTINEPVCPESITNRIINQNLFDILHYLPDSFVDLLFLDPPYNLTKIYNGRVFKKNDESEYAAWFESFFVQLLPILKPDASVYVCSDWRSGATMQTILEKHLFVRNRITWEREKGRGAMYNWKNCSEDIWYCTKGKEYTFNLDAVKLKRRVRAPYRTPDGTPKDWNEEEDGKFRNTHPSNLWNDITIPFWSMPENTDHPTQKPEKLIARLLLASTNKGDLVFDPFVGSGSSAVVARKLFRNYVGIEINTDYCLLAEKRLSLCDNDRSIQGYENGYFLERNSKL